MLRPDVPRCPGYEAEGEWREGCEDCLRRTDRSTFPLANWMTPPALIVFECEARIDPAAVPSTADDADAW